MNCIHSNQGVDRDEHVIYHQGQNIKLPTRIVRTSTGNGKHLLNHWKQLLTVTKLGVAHKNSSIWKVASQGKLKHVFKIFY